MTTKTKIIVKRFVMMLTQDICANIWQAYERDLVKLIDESEFLEIMDDLTDENNVAALASVAFVYPKDGAFEEYLNDLQKETLVIEHYKDGEL